MAEAVDHYFVGLTQQASAGGLARLRGHGALTIPASRVYPVGARFKDFVQPLVTLLNDDAHVREIILRPVLGRYGSSQELSVGLEVKAAGGFDAAALAAGVFSLAYSAAQTDAFVGRVLPPGEWTDNARPGLTVMFKAPTRIADTVELVRQIVGFPGEGWAIDGFTMIPSADSRIGVVQGLRYIFLPEISIRWDAGLRERLSADEDEIDVILLDQATRIGRLCRALTQNETIEAAWLSWFDIMVAGIEDYREVIVTLEAEQGARAADPKSMTRMAFSEILQLTSAGVLQTRLGHLGGAGAQREAGERLNSLPSVAA
ncbi:hypothetical protein [Caballeronia insecticola]|uniref:Uncharacterized protein n=1 Tax=Caballeronia insecticola TaxID=758793 RepID=R4WPQ5_9BURK|nr:hypothetical protein [Caballeronia insecticola]BAN26564.1 putative uncharacterized protein [Caballeronia insecticola]